MKKAFASLSALLLLALAHSPVASAEPAVVGSHYEGMAKPWQLNFQEAATPVMERLIGMHDILLIIITAIVLLVLAIMIYISLRFRRSANPTPSQTTHNTALEIIWTSIPILILIVIAIPSLRAHYYMQRAFDPEMTLKVVGNQWFWHYDYPDQGGFGFDSYMKKAADLKEGEPRLLTVDNRVVVPVDTTVRVLVTGSDVIHSWAVPAFGVKRDGVPGRLNETWFRATRTGTFYGQCSELCGIGHGFMPIVVEVVSKDEFNNWAQGRRDAAGIAAPVAQPAVERVSESGNANKQPIDKQKKTKSKASEEPAATMPQAPAQRKPAAF